MSFRLIEQQAPAQGNTVPFVVPLRSKRGQMILHVEYLGESNAAYMHELLADIAARGPVRPRKDMSAPAMLKALREARDKKREVVIRHAVREIENVWHDDGTEATTADIPHFIHALPDDVFDALWQFCEDATNFRDVVINADPETTAGK